MESKRGPGQGIRGWSVRQKAGPLQAARARDERNWREILEASGGRILRGALLGLGAWVAVILVLGDKGLLHLQALRAEERRLRSENQALAREHAQVLYELKEDPGLSMERVLREQYRKSLEGEIVLQAVPAAPDSGFGWRAGPAPAEADRPGSADEKPERRAP